MHARVFFTLPVSLLRLALLAGSLSLAAAAPARAQTLLRQDVRVRVMAVNEFAAGEPVTLTIGSAVPGRGLTPAHAASYYSIHSNAGGRKGRRITAELSAAYAPGLALRARMEAPPGASSAGWQELTPVPVTLVENVAMAKGERLKIEYEAAADLTVSPGSYTQTVTFTFTKR